MIGASIGATAGAAAQLSGPGSATGGAAAAKVGATAATVAGAGGPIPRTTPNADFLPGGSVLVNLANGLEYWALMIALIGLLLGAAVWAIGSHSQNFNQSVAGRRAVVVCALAALLVGAAPSLLNWMWTTGGGLG